jgi:VanZ family protein
MNKFSLLFGVLIVVITWLAVTPLSVPQVDVDYGDKVNHVAAFAVLYVVGYKSWNSTSYLFVGLIFYGVLIEIIQSFIPFRYASAEDVVADVAGIAIGHLAVYVLRRRRIV